MPVVNVNVSGLQGLAAKLRTVSTTAEQKFYDGLEEAGELIADEARARSNYSSKIPGSIHTEMAGPGLVRVGSTLREAVAIENRGKGFVRHPLYGTRDHWYSNPQPAFLHPAAEARRAEARDKVVEVVHEAFVEAGL